MVMIMMTDGMALIYARAAGMAVMKHAALATTSTSTVYPRLLHLLVKAGCYYSLD
jgi:hypothetical protein